jgi:ABC-type taurine transport system ATPase subunit
MDIGRLPFEGTLNEGLLSFLLRMREACFAARGAPVGPVTLDVDPGERAALVCASVREANVVALLAAGIVKAGSGCVLLDQYDPRVQPAHCKRVAAFVPHDPLPLAGLEFERYVAYRAALWGLDPRRALAHAKLLMERLEGVHEAFAVPLAGALVCNPKILILDRPQPVHAACIVAAAGPRAIFSTHLNAADAGAFQRLAAEEALA